MDLLQGSLLYCLSAALPFPGKNNYPSFRIFTKAHQNHVAVTLFDCQLLLQPHGATVSFQSVLGVQSCWMAESPQVQERGLAVGQSWAAYLDVSEATVQMIPKCAHQWLAWKHVGPISQVLLQQLLSSWCALFSLLRLHAGRKAAHAVPGSGLHEQLQHRSDRTREGLRRSSASCFPGLFSSPWPVCSLLERNLLSVHL